MKIDIPKYQQIAADIAAKIAYGDYLEGEKIYVRSSLASQYGVSSETARRAVCVLSDMKIVEITKGSGVLIKSRKLAMDFINKFDSVSQMSELKKHILNSIEQQITQSTELKTMVTELMYKTERFRVVNPFSPFEIAITEHASYIGQNLSESNFWHNTAATVIAIRRGEQIIISPGPYAVITEGDILYYVGDENCHERVKNFLYSK
ncbi:regulatory GntR family protein [Kineothrix alysoides]|uniref:Regulatory GntR family protein n=1 Tax=Kineothrix alysoides TaxID=1469948 RepID=A0A4R1QZF4_9FIRM|nr:TrkA C-terminal domain-containing protein [Kineothrix alysoides]TCL58383.1 regulatory GntR family protein [Kineothrix alysoides]